MEVLIILIVLFIIGYVIYDSLPNAKFKKGESLLKGGNLEEAIKIFTALFTKNPNAPAKLAECKLMKGIGMAQIDEKLALINLNQALEIKNRFPAKADKAMFEIIECKVYFEIAELKLRQARKIQSINETEAIAIFKEALEIKNKLPNSSDKAKFESIEAKAYFEIAQIQYNRVINSTKALDKIRILNVNLRFIEGAIKVGITNDFETLRKKHLAQLGEIYFSLGKDNEKSRQYSEAEQYYGLARDNSATTKDSKILYNAITRLNICHLKNKQQVDINSLDAMDKSQQDYKIEFYYRYTINLIKIEEYAKAEKIITQHLNISSSGIDKLRKLLLNERLKSANEKVTFLNNRIEDLYDRKFPVAETKELYDSLDKIIADIILAIPSLTNKLKDIKPSIFKRLLRKYISDENFSSAINIIRDFPTFWEKPELLNAMGVCCFGFIEQGRLKETNYKTIISNWLTAIFSDRMILKSLEDYTWDDEYTFTLKDAIGSNCAIYGDLPSNVNYETASETNISVGSVQRELLQQFENLLNQNIESSSLSKLVIEFYNQEKQAIQNVIEIVEEDIFFAPPYFAKVYHLNQSIVDALANDYVNFFNEYSLLAGIPYLENNKTSAITEYSTAKDLVTKIITAIQKENPSELEAILIDGNIHLIKKFKGISSTIENLVFNAFEMKISEDEENEELIPLMIHCINKLPTTSKLTYQFARYVPSLCITKVNNKELDNFNALNFMRQAILANPSDERNAENISVLLQFNLEDVIYERINSGPLSKLLDSIEQPHLSALLSMYSSSGFDLSSIPAKYEKIFELVDTIRNLGNPKIKKACEGMRLVRSEIIDKIGSENMGKLVLSSQGRAIKRALDLMYNLSA